MLFTIGLLHGCVPLEDRIDLVYETWCASPREEVVGCVYDGDTFYTGGCGLAVEEDFRVLGVQAPELGPSSESGDSECYGDEAAYFLDELITGQEVSLEFDVECVGTFDRTLAWVFLEGTEVEVVSLLDDLGGLGLVEEGRYRVLVNELMIRAGYATVYRGDVASNIRYVDRLEEAEDQAEAEGLGLWSECVN